MIQTQTILKVADNSGAKTAKCIKILTQRSYASVGDCILVSIRCVRGGSIKKGQIYKALVIRTKKRQSRSMYGFRYVFQTNEVVLINNQGHLTGSRIFGSITRDLRARNYRKIISQSKRML
jgi:large subunit ribosomal protein L14